MIHREPNHASMACRTAAMAITALVVWATPLTVAWAADAPSCLSATGEAAIAPCRRELLDDPGNTEIRFALSDAFMGLRRYADAVAVLREGLENFPGDDSIKKRLILAESYLEEHEYIENQKKKAAAASGSKNQDTQIRLNLIRCEKLKGDAAMAACNEGLAMNPDHPDLLTGRGNVWLEMDRFGSAIRDYQAALAADPKNRDATKNLRLARTKREVKVAQCLQADGPDGLKACDAALLIGASDEFAIQKHRAALLHAMGRENDAIEAYRSAARLNPADGQVKQALAALSPIIETPTTEPAPETSPAPSRPTVVATVKPLPPPEIKSPTRPVAPAAPPNKAKAVAAKPPIQSSPAKAAIAAPEPPAQPSPVKKAASAPEPLPLEKTVSAPSKPSPSIKMAAVQPRRYSNAPEVPGITH